MIISELSQDPITQFGQVFELAKSKSQSDPTAMVLSTATVAGRPSSRVVLLKNVSADGFSFFTNYQSRKAEELFANPNAALCFYWPEINIQVRIEGTVVQTSDVDSDAYFASRQRISQIGAWASEQSQPLENREVLMARVRDLTENFEGTAVPRPTDWGGFLLRPDSVEFWYNGDYRLHDRFVYTRIAGSEDWKIQQLNP